MYKWNWEEQWNHSKIKMVTGRSPWRMVWEGPPEQATSELRCEGWEEPSCEGTAKTKGGGGELSLCREPKVGCVARAEWVGEALYKMKLEKGHVPDQGGPCQSWKGVQIFFLYAKGSHLRVSSREVTWLMYFLKYECYDKPKEEKIRNLLFLWVQEDRRKLCLLPIHVPHITSNCGWYLLQDSLYDIACN